MPKCILSGQVKSTFTQEQADDRYIQMTNGATTTLASSLQAEGINNIEFTEEEEDSITASNVSYSNTTSGMTSGNVQNAIDELFQSVSEGKSLIAAAVTDKGVETAATDSFATMAGNIGQISGGAGGGVFSIISIGNYDIFQDEAAAGEIVIGYLGAKPMSWAITTVETSRDVPVGVVSGLPMQYTFVMPSEDVFVGIS